MNLLNAKILTHCSLQIAQVAWLGMSYTGKNPWHYAYDKLTELPGLSLGMGQPSDFAQ